jgi:hypothetical protein
MNCAEFQRDLPYIIDSGGNAEHRAHLATCPVCSDLVSDLRYIAEQAKLLVPMEEPPARVWQNIEQALQQEQEEKRRLDTKTRVLRSFPG